MSFIQYLKGNTEFKLLMADRIQKHLIADGGALTPAEAIKRYEKLADEIDLPIIGESARWGDYRKDVAPNDDTRILYTRNDHWLPRKQDLLTNYFPKRTDILVEQLRKAGLFPGIQAPVLSHASGKYKSAFVLGITSQAGEIYYTIDGSDPREPITSKVTSLALLFKTGFSIDSSVTIKARTKSGSEWSPLSEAFYQFGDITTINEIAQSRTIDHGNYPNPFIESTQIFYNLPNDGKVQIDIYGIDGRLVENLFVGHQFRGYNSLKWHSSNNKPGMYFYRIQFDKQAYTGKLLLH